MSPKFGGKVGKRGKQLWAMFPVVANVVFSDNNPHTQHEGLESDKGFFPLICDFIYG